MQYPQIWRRDERAAASAPTKSGWDRACPAARLSGQLAPLLKEGFAMPTEPTKKIWIAPRLEELAVGKTLTGPIPLDTEATLSGQDQLIGGPPS
jgi:hypothetical protein